MIQLISIQLYDVQERFQMRWLYIRGHIWHDSRSMIQSNSIILQMRLKI